MARAHARAPSESRRGRRSRAISRTCSDSCSIAESSISTRSTSKRRFPSLERLIDAEAVHPVNEWREMGRRLEADRRCYAFFHPAWPQEPLIFTEVALTRGIASLIQPILDPDSPVVDPRTCDTAMFYSISNCQPGLRGFSFGNALLSRAIEQLRAEMPWLRRFATISPIPGFRSWLSASAGSLDPSKDDLLALCAHYLLRVKQGGEPADCRRALPSWQRGTAASPQRVERLVAGGHPSLRGRHGQLRLRAE